MGSTCWQNVQPQALNTVHGEAWQLCSSPGISSPGATADDGEASLSFIYLFNRAKKYI